MMQISQAAMFENRRLTPWKALIPETKKHKILKFTSHKIRRRKLNILNFRPTHPCSVSMRGCFHFVQQMRMYHQLRARRVLMQVGQRCSIENQKGAIAVQYYFICTWRKSPPPPSFERVHGAQYISISTPFWDPTAGGGGGGLFFTNLPNQSAMITWPN